MNHKPRSTIHEFLQNKPNLLYPQMNVNTVTTKDYENKQLYRCGQNKPNSNPIQTQSKPILTQYKPKTNPIQTQYLTALRSVAQDKFHRNDKKGAFSAQREAESSSSGTTPHYIVNKTSTAGLSGPAILILQPSGIGRVLPPPYQLYEVPPNIGASKGQPQCLQRICQQ